MRGLLLLGTLVLIVAFVIAGDLATDSPTSDPITEERICTEEDFSPEDSPSAPASEAFNFGNAVPDDCELPPALRRQP